MQSLQSIVLTKMILFSSLYIKHMQWRHQGGHGGIYPHPSEALPPPPHMPPQSERKNGQNQPFSAIFLIFAPSESHFAPSMPPTKKNSGAATEHMDSAK